MVIELFKRLIQRYYDTGHEEKHKRKLNNRGMSLVEVIISITILSIVVVPTLHAISSAMSYNLKSRRRQEATLAGESIMESFKGYDIEKLKTVFSNGGKTNIKKADGTTEEKGFYGEPGNGNYAYLENIDGSGNLMNYDFTINDLLTDTGKTYNVEIVATPDKAEAIYTVKNMKEPGQTACIKCDTSWNDIGPAKNKALERFNAECPDFQSYVNDKAAEITGHPEDIAENMSYSQLTNGDVQEGNIVIDERIMEFDILSDKVYPKVIYKYHVSGVPFYVPVRSKTGGIPDGYVEGDPIPPVVEKIVGRELKFLDRYPAGEEKREFTYVDESASLTVTASDMSEVYLYYYPNYEVARDTIKIVNTTGNPVTCYLIKQQSDKYSKTKTEINETKYKAYVEGTGDITLYHNLRQNIGDYTKTIADQSITGCTDKNIADFDSAVTDKKTDKVLSYNITLTISDTDGNVITSMDSTMNEK